MQVASTTMSIDFSIRWRPFFLDPSLPAGEGKDKMQHYREKFGAERVAQMAPTMIQTFKDEGINGYTMEGRVGNTMDSHRLLEYALAQGGTEKQNALCEALFDAYFLRGRALSSRSVLLEAAEKVQLDGAAALLDSEAGQEAVWAEVQRAYSSGVSGVPYFRIDGGGRGKEGRIDRTKTTAAPPCLVAYLRVRVLHARSSRTKRGQSLAGNHPKRF